MPACTAIFVAGEVTARAGRGRCRGNTVSLHAVRDIIGMVPSIAVRAPTRQFLGVPLSKAPWTGECWARPYGALPD
jgi:hypothetical protein